MEFFFIRFRPGKMPRIADVSPAGLVDHTEDYIPRLLGMDADAIGERLLGATSLEGKTRIMESIFRSYGMNSVCQDHRCNQAVEMVESLEGRIKVVELSRELGISYQTLERMFLQQVGVTPKQFIRNIRFQKTMEKLKGGARFTTLGDLASECGFADQSHFIKEFKRLAQRLPSAF
jgi:AraC-like DNA-binding protein